MDVQEENTAPPAGTVVCSGVLERRVVLVAEAHGQQLLSALREFRARGLLLDFSLHVQNQSLPCHRCVLASCSHFFRAMFEVDMCECDAGSVTLTNLSSQAVRVFLDFAYSGEIEITDDNVDMMFQLASFLQVDVLSRACSDFLIQTLNLSNCLHLLSVAEGYGSARLLRCSVEFIVANFHSLSSSTDFLEMPGKILELCLSDDLLNIPDEESVLRSLLRWTQFDLKERRPLLSKLLAHVRLHQLPLALLEEVSKTEPLLLEDEDCTRVTRASLQQAKDFSGFFPDARPATTASYIYVHKSEEDRMTRHAFCYDVKADRWHQLPQNASEIADLPGSSLASFAEKLFLTGGCRGSCHRTVRLHISELHHEATDEVWCYCPVSGSFVQVPSMGKPRTMHASVTALRRLYVIGGKTFGESKEQSLLDVEYYDPLQRSWTLVSPLPRMIYFPEVAACGSVVYVLGSELEISETFNPSLDCFLRYDALADQWCQLVAEFGQFFHATLVKSVSVNETLYLCDLSTYKVYSFCPETCIWKGEGSFECAGFNAGAVGVRDRIYILGGDYSPDEISDEVQVYHSLMGGAQWEEVAPMPRGLTEFHCQALSFNHYRDPWRSEVEETPRRNS